MPFAGYETDLARMAREVEARPGAIGVYSTSEQIAVALLLNKPELLPHGYTNILEAVERLGADWLEGITRMHKEGW